MCGGQEQGDSQARTCECELMSQREERNRRLAPKAYVPATRCGT